MDRERKGIMRHRAGQKLWTLILALALIGSGFVTTPRQTWADEFPTDPAPSPNPSPNGAGDPDWPPSRNQAPEGTPTRTPSGGLVLDQAPVRSVWAAKWMWSFRVAFASVSRLFLRF